MSILQRLSSGFIKAETSDKKRRRDEIVQSFLSGIHSLYDIEFQKRFRLDVRQVGVWRHVEEVVNLQPVNKFFFFHFPEPLAIVMQWSSWFGSILELRSRWGSFGKWTIQLRMWSEKETPSKTNNCYLTSVTADWPMAADVSKMITCKGVDIGTKWYILKQDCITFY